MIHTAIYNIFDTVKYSMIKTSAYDQIETIGKSLIQHGKNSDRIYLMKLDLLDYPEIVSELLKIADEKNYTKIIAKVPSYQKNNFLEEGFTEEASIPNFFNSNKDVSFLSKFTNTKREYLSPEIKKVIVDNLSIALNKAGSKKSVVNSYNIKSLNKEDAGNLTELYKKVFETYPFPIHDEKYIKETMDDNLMYFGIYKDGNLIAASSAEIDFKSKNAEMTDFATLPEYRGKGLASQLLAKMEDEMMKIGVCTLYTIARAHSIGMNVTFSRAQYSYGGTLINNTDISGKIESMNVWYKNLFI